MRREEICPNCFRPRKQNKPGSLTQWMFSCGCEMTETGTTTSLRSSLCKLCGKRIGVSRAGSFTQWVFRPESCACSRPIVLEQTGEPAHDRSIRLAIAAELDDEIELELDLDVFPGQRYKALAEIGGGSTGDVFLCRDRLLGTKVALKCLRNVSRERLLLFQREARLAGKLSHRNIVKIFDLGVTESGAPYMVMTYIAGPSVKRHIAENGPFRVAVALRIIAQVADALAYAHNRGILHRDITSSNILLINPDSEKPSAQVIDFGISTIKNAHQEPPPGNSLILAGTPAYMPPDQALGKEYDERSEVYSLGCVLFEMVSGVPPFEGETALEVMNKHAGDEAPQVVTINPDSDCTDEVNSIIGSCLAKNQDDRFQSVEEFRDACSALCADEAELDPICEESTEGSILLSTFEGENTDADGTAIPRYGKIILAFVALGVCFPALASLTTGSVSVAAIYSADICWLLACSLLARAKRYTAWIGPAFALPGFLVVLCLPRRAKGPEKAETIAFALVALARWSIALLLGKTIFLPPEAAIFPIWIKLIPFVMYFLASILIVRSKKRSYWYSLIGLIPLAGFLALCWLPAGDRHGMAQEPKALD